MTILGPWSPEWRSLKKAAEEGLLREGEADEAQRERVRTTSSRAREILASEEKLAILYGDAECVNPEEKHFARQLLENMAKARQFGREETTLPLDRQRDIQDKILGIFSGRVQSSLSESGN
jgi:hypothetical protein